MRLNDGILPLDTIRGGKCEGRSDGLCALDDFLESQAGAYELSNYDYACFANYSLADPMSGKDYDGRISADDILLEECEDVEARGKDSDFRAAEL